MLRRRIAAVERKGGCSGEERWWSAGERKTVGDFWIQRQIKSTAVGAAYLQRGRANIQQLYKMLQHK
jgi:hypothetical protein